MDSTIATVLTHLTKALHIISKELVIDSWSKMVSDNYTPYVNNSYLGTVEALLNADVPVMVVGGLNDGQLSFLKVLSAGHLAVLDQPLLINKILEKLGA